MRLRNLGNLPVSPSKSFLRVFIPVRLRSSAMLGNLARLWSPAMLGDPARLRSPVGMPVVSPEG